MSLPSHIRHVVPITHMTGDDQEDTSLLIKLSMRAETYLLSHNWCRSIIEAYYGMGIGGVYARFLYRIIPITPHVDEWLWVLIGDIPPAYLVLDDCSNPALALEGYIQEMRLWVEAVRSNSPVADLIPVNVAPTVESANILSRRLDFLEKEILVQYQDRLKE